MASVGKAMATGTAGAILYSAIKEHLQPEGGSKIDISGTYLVPVRIIFNRNFSMKRIKNQRCSKARERRLRKFSYTTVYDLNDVTKKISNCTC